MAVTPPAFGNIPPIAIEDLARDVLLRDMGSGLPFQPGVFDGAIRLVKFLSESSDFCWGVDNETLIVFDGAIRLWVAHELLYF